MELHQISEQPRPARRTCGQVSDSRRAVSESAVVTQCESVPRRCFEIGGAAGRGSGRRGRAQRASGEAGAWRRSLEESDVKGTRGRVAQGLGRGGGGLRLGREVPLSLGRSRRGSPCAERWVRSLGMMWYGVRMESLPARVWCDLWPALAGGFARASVFRRRRD